MSLETAKECTALSDEGKISFPEVVQRLSQSGIELYYADLLSSSKTYYASNKAFTVNCSLDSKKEVADDFNSNGVAAAIKDIQSNRINYQEFIKKIMSFGVVSYMVFITGCKAVYFGRKGEQHTEEFISQSN